MDAMRSIISVLVLVLVGCGAAEQNKKAPDILEKLELDRIAYSTASSEAQAASDNAVVAQREADAKEVARVKSAQNLALSLEKSASVHEAKARGYRDEVCKYDPGRCGGPGNSPGPAKAEYYDLRVDSFTNGNGATRISPSVPPGWRHAVEDGTVRVYSGQVVVNSLKGHSPGQADGSCYRFSQAGVEAIKCY